MYDRYVNDKPKTAFDLTMERLQAADREAGVALIQARLRVINPD